jgi:methyltransferase
VTPERIVFSFGLVVFAAMTAEAIVSARHDRALTARGAVEPPGDVIGVMAIAYPACFVAILGEGLLREAGSIAAFAPGLALFAAAKALKYWAIVSLGERWTFRVLVPPGAVSIVKGPYRWLAHPNYVAVAGEIAGAAIAMHAIVAGPIAFAGFGLLMLRRIKVEEAALAAGRMSAR